MYDYNVCEICRNQLLLWLSQIMFFRRNNTPIIIDHQITADIQQKTIWNTEGAIKYVFKKIIVFFILIQLWLIIILINQMYCFWIHRQLCNGSLQIFDTVNKTI